MSPSPAPHKFVDHVDGLAEIARALQTAAWVALDSESNSMFVHREQVCLLQLNVAGAIFVVDTLALGVDPRRTPSSALDLLREGLGRSDRPLWLHGGEYDVACVRRDFGIALGGVWDTQQAASLLGWPKTGYGSVVEQLCGVSLGKAYAQYDWATRPLDKAALAYAIDDVVYLPRVAETLKKAVEGADIADELAMQNAVVAATLWTGGFEPSSLWRLRDVERAPPYALKLLARLLRWREDAASDENVPPGRLVNNEVLLAIARHPPTSLADLKRAGVKASVLARHGDTALHAVRAADHDDVPRRPLSTPPSPAMAAREARLKAWRRDESERRARAEGRAIPLQLVLPARSLDHLRVHGAGDLDAVPQLGARRRERYGDALRALCNVTAAPDDASPGA